MIKVILSLDGRGEYRSLEMNGHALFSEYGKDVVCAGVSALTINTINSIEVFCRDKFSVDTNGEGGYIKLMFTEDISEQAKLLMDSLMLGLDGIEEEYGKKYITIIRQEV